MRDIHSDDVEALFSQKPWIWELLEVKDLTGHQRAILCKLPSNTFQARRNDGKPVSWLAPIFSKNAMSVERTLPIKL